MILSACARNDVQLYKKILRICVASDKHRRMCKMTVTAIVILPVEGVYLCCVEVTTVTAD